MEAKVISRSGLIRTVPFVILDVAATFAAYMISAWGSVPMLGTYGPLAALGCIVLLAAVNVATFSLMHMYSCLWEYASIDEALRIVAATFVGSVVGDVLIFLLFGLSMPVSVYIGSWAILLIITGASRLLVRVTSGRKGWALFGASQKGLPRSLIIGAGETGSLVVKRMLNFSPDIPGSPLVLVDDNPGKLGSYVHGVRVEGTCDDIPALAERHGIEQIVVAIPSATRKERERIYGICMSTGIRTVTMPNISNLPLDKLGRVALRDVEVQDLLARDEIKLDTQLVGSYITGKRVLVTGGGGSIGSELVRQLLPARPAQIVIFDIYENTAYELFHEIKGECAEKCIDLHVEIGSITHLPAIRGTFRKYCPEVVFHAAAHKHVPLMEDDPREAIENNVFGTLNVARLADEWGCTHFVQISTDKAVNPTNVMGATKRMDEMVIQYYASVSKTVFAAVRFGNVLGSHGSVIPLFKRQLKEGGPITVTHKDIVRYFMTIPEASRLVITAGALAKGGEIFILNMGEPVRIYDLAQNLIKLSGLKPGVDIEIKVTGLRPGEKMYEELLMDTEKTLPTDNKDIMISTGDVLDLSTVQHKLSLLEKCLDKDNDTIKRALAEAVPTYSPEVGR